MGSHEMQIDNVRMSVEITFDDRGSEVASVLIVQTNVQLRLRLNSWTAPDILR